MRRMLVVGVMSMIAIVGTAVPAVAQPPGQEKSPEAWVCDGEDTLIVTDDEPELLTLTSKELLVL